MPRWYYLLILRAMNLICVVSLAVAAIIAFCIGADWFGQYRVGLSLVCRTFS